MRRRRQDGAGFTLLEVMIALSILAITLVTILGMVTNNIRATRHAKLTTAGTFLARGKMIDIEDLVLESGFSTSDETAAGTFKDQGYPDFRWTSAIERVELPMDAMQKKKDEAQDKARDSTNPMGMLTGFIGGMMSSFIEPIRLGLQESVRRVTIRVYWSEAGRGEQVIEVVQYLTDPSKLDAAMGLGARGAAPGVPGAPGTPGAPGAVPGAGGLTAPGIAPGGLKQ
jgi:prepilin-type N-terminal cleavage/methylation domain-containing protein